MNNDDYVICKWCGKHVKRIYGAHIKKHHIGKTSLDYKLDFGNDIPLTSKNDYIKTTKNSGQHMKTEKYKKMFSEKIKGYNNPNSKNKTTEEQRKSISPYSPYFYIRKYIISYDDAVIMRDEFLKNINKLVPSQIEYWKNKGYSNLESAEMVSKNQQTFSKEKLIQKYGEFEGLKIWNTRQKKWQESLSNNGNMKGGYSKVSQVFFNDIYNLYPYYIKKYLNYSKLNGEYIIRYNDKNYKYDFVDLYNKKIIEYNGDIFHANPKKYSEEQTPNPYKKHLTSKQIWDYDNNKLEVAKINGFELLVIWESDYLEDKNKVLQKCLDFLGI